MGMLNDAVGWVNGIAWGPLMPFRLVWCSMVVVGAVIAGWEQIRTGAEFVFLLSGTLNAIMAIPNLIALAALSPIVFKLTQEFFDTRGK